MGYRSCLSDDRAQRHRRHWARFDRRVGGHCLTEGTTVAIIEVMKMFNAIPAGLRGVITEICVQDAQFVEYGQTLFRVRPPEAS